MNYRDRREGAITTVLVATELFLLLIAERRFARDHAHLPRLPRLRRNGTIAGIAVAASLFVETPVVLWAASLSRQRGGTFLSRLRLPPKVRVLVAVACLDYGMYAWHRALHVVPLLWRLHLVHHADRELDVTTSLRVHAVEIAASAGARAALVFALGVNDDEILLWQRLFAMSILFQHANVRLPRWLERGLGTIIVTPGRHRIHHLAERSFQHSNWSTGLVLWDRLHRTLRDESPSVVLGLPGCYRGEESFRTLLSLPFTQQPDPWAID